jgi:MoaA/NifB/PqqE/SkfB family radical SAM enzyme
MTPAAERFEKIYIEISNVCNLHCDFCPEVERPQAFMPLALFERIAADVAPLTEQVCLHLMGEPLAHPRISDIIEACAQVSLPINLTSNGTLLGGERSRALLRPIVRQINFSIHSFEANFPEEDINPYLDRIFQFTADALRLRPDLYINFRLWNLEASSAQRNAHILAQIEAAFHAPAPTNIDPRRGKSRHVVGRLYIHFDTRFDWPNFNAPERSPRGTCRALSSHLGILADGTVVPCCLDKEGIMALGDARRQTLSEILSGERASRMKQGFAQGRLLEDLCRHCGFISRFDRKVRGLDVIPNKG